MRGEIPLVILDLSGEPVTNASVAIYVRGTTNAAAIYQAATGAPVHPNPTVPNSSGRVEGWLERGAYDAVITAPGLTGYTEQFDIAPAGDGGIDAAWIPNGGITLAKLDLTGGTNGEVLAISGGVPMWSPVSIGTPELVDGAVTSAKMAAGASRSQDYGTALPSSGLYNGYRFVLFSGSAAWALVYRADVDATYPWIVTGGTTLYSVTDPAGNALPASLGTFTPAPAVTIPRQGVYEVSWGAWVSGSGGRGATFVVSGPGLTAAEANGRARAQEGANTYSMSVATQREYSFNAGGSVTLHGLKLGGGDPDDLSEVFLSVRPKRMG